MNKNTAHKLFNLALFAILAITVIASAVMLATLTTWVNNTQYIEQHCTEREIGINAVSPWHNDTVTVCNFSE